jgi:hypothetical protein
MLDLPRVKTVERKGREREEMIPVHGMITTTT